MAWQLKMSTEQAQRMNDRVVEMLLEGEDPKLLLELLDNAVIAEEEQP